MVELMFVVLIIGLLIAIALTAFLGARMRAQNRAAQADLRNALVVAKVVYSDSSDYTAATAAGLAAVEVSMSFVDGSPAANSTQVGVAAISGSQWAAARQSASGTCFYISDGSNGTRFGQAGGAGACVAPTMALAADPAWT